MRSRQLAEVLLAIVGIWFVASAVVSLPFLIGIFGTVSGSDDGVGRLELGYISASTFLRIAIGGPLILARSRIATWICEPDETDSLEASSWQPAAFAVLGAYFFVEGTAAGLGTAALGSSGVSSWSLAGDGLEAACGLALFFGARGLSRLWHQMRGAGTEGRAA